ncbi:MAG: ferrous iron transport protein B [Oscillospiraceae bacterium]|nr:ferrous iron transport protein B [Oscillospiraceae bacterium]
MGLTKSSVGQSILKSKSALHNVYNEEVKTVALAGNPNVGKSTLFNALTGMKQHTGNWAGKTVDNAKGYYKTAENIYALIDIPGTYSLIARSAEEECARNFICFGESDAVVVVCDATCLERNMNLVLQTMEICKNTVVCVNLMDEAERKGISLDLNELQKRLGTKVVGVTAKNKKSLRDFGKVLDSAVKEVGKEYKISYSESIERAISLLEAPIKRIVGDRLSARWLSLRLLSKEEKLMAEASMFLGAEIAEDQEIKKSLQTALFGLSNIGITPDKIRDMVASAVVLEAEKLIKGTVSYKGEERNSFDRKADKIFSGKYTAYPIMLLLLGLVFWITVEGANYPSAALSALFSEIEVFLNRMFRYFGAPEFLRGILVDGAYKVSSWVVAVMLPPMAIFFPFFTLLEDSGYLPRIAYNLDAPFKRCSACGKQALTMSMGFGCNAAGVTGCRIIDSKRERLLAVLTNSFVPCNGKFPALIAIITMFFTLSLTGFYSSAVSALMLLLCVVLAVIMTMLATKMLSKTLLKGVPSAFTLELPPYRKPKILEVFVRSVFDRTLFVLGRALTAAIPAGIILWLAANISVGDTTVLRALSDFLDPFAKLIGLDGVILIAFVLGLPANEIVIPIMVMAYTSGSVLTETASIAELKNIFMANGWNEVTAICVLIFFLFHWPCATTLLTVKKETGSFKWSALAFLIPTVTGILLCALVSLLSKI